MKQEWKNRPLLYKIATVLQLPVSAAIIVLAVLQLFDVWSDAGYVYVPLTGINLLLQANAQWEPNRKVAIFSLCSGVIVLICTVVVYIIK